MGKFRKRIETSNQQTKKPINQYSDADMRKVNAAGFQVPLVVRNYWVAQSSLRNEKLAPLLKGFLIERYGLPDGITADDIGAKPINQ